MTLLSSSVRPSVKTELSDVNATTPSREVVESNGDRDWETPLQISKISRNPLLC